MIRIGPAGWSYPDWEGVVYPRRKPKDFHPLRHLARYFDCVEINSSFYGAPVPRNAEHWAELVHDPQRAGCARSCGSIDFDGHCEVSRVSNLPGNDRAAGPAGLTILPAHTRFRRSSADDRNARS